MEQDLAMLGEARGLSQSQLARIAGVSQPEVNRIESGRFPNMKIGTLHRMVTALGGRLEIRIVPEATAATRVVGIRRERRRPAASGGRCRRRGDHPSARLLAAPKGGGRAMADKYSVVRARYASTPHPEYQFAVVNRPVVDGSVMDEPVVRRFISRGDAEEFAAQLNRRCLEQAGRMADATGGLVTLRDLPGWPPVWTVSYAGMEEHPSGEVGTLENAELDPAETEIKIWIDLGDQRTSGTLPVRRELAPRILGVLRAHYGRPLAEVGPPRSQWRDDVP